VPTARWPCADQPQGRDFIDREIDEYRADWTDLNVSSPIAEACFDWIEANRIRAYGPPALTHNDFNFNNLLVDGSVVTAVLDWEFAHVGTAAADLGYFYYSAEAVSSFRAFLAAYSDAGGNVPSKEQLDFYILWAQLRLVVMCFKVVKGFEQGDFDDIRYGITIKQGRQTLLRLADLLARLETAIA
jgi:aminoglycoside phosphotransferase (APT) family kinase protein